MNLKSCKICNQSPYESVEPCSNATLYSIGCNNCQIQVVRIDKEESIMIWNKLMSFSNSTDGSGGVDCTGLGLARYPFGSGGGC